MEERIKNLIERMSVEEKIAQLGSVYITGLVEGGKISREKMDKFLKNGIGQISRAFGGMKESEPEVPEEFVYQIKKFLREETNLKIPAMFHEECLSGFMTNRATTFPQAIGMASTWNPGLIQKITTVIRKQMKSAGVHHGLSPVLDVCYDPRWGRTEETLGEDPYLVASMGVAYVKGLQGKSLKDGIIATGKHFAAHGFLEGGRNLAPVHTGERELRDIFLFPFEACVKEAQLGSIMNAYHDIDGVPCVSSKKLLTDILRKEWGFKGIVVSDYGAIEMLRTFHFVAADKKEAAVLALSAGMDIELPGTDCYGMPLIEAIKEGLVSEEVLDRAVARVLKMKFEMGLFDEELEEKSGKVRIHLDTKEDRNLAFKAALESIVLLKNDGKVLPLKKNTGSIAVIGPSADNPRLYFGDYGFTAHLNLEKPAVECKSLLKMIKEKISGKTEILYAKGCEITGDSKEGFQEAIKVVKKADVSIVAVGELSGVFPSSTVGEGKDSHTIKLPGVQEDLIRELVKTGKPVVVVLINGRALDLFWIANNVSAILECWFPGEEGAKAISEVLFGDYNPSGKLPISFPKSVGQIPVYYHRKNSSFKNYVFLDSQPLFPFGHGLSYTEFKYSNLKIEPSVIAPEQSISISVDIENTGDVKGTEVVQLYIKDVVASITRPLMQLKGFEKVIIESGEKARVMFKVPSEILAFYNKDIRLIIEPGVFEVLVGSSSVNIKVKGEFEIEGTPKVIRTRNKFFSKVKVETLSFQ